MSESGAHSQRILAIVVIFFSSYIVGIYSAARASSQLLLQQQQQHQQLQWNQSRLNDSLDALDESLAAGTELAEARNGTRNPRCKYQLRMSSSARASKSCSRVGIFNGTLSALLSIRMSLSAIRLFCRRFIYVCGSHFNYHPVRRFRAGLFSLRHALAPHLAMVCVVSQLSQIGSDWIGSETWLAEQLKSFPYYLLCRFAGFMHGSKVSF